MSDILYKVILKRLKRNLSVYFNKIKYQRRKSAKFT
jgi:hypothetical protein